MTNNDDVALTEKKGKRTQIHQSNEAIERRKMQKQQMENDKQNMQYPFVMLFEDFRKIFPWDEKQEKPFCHTRNCIIAFSNRLHVEYNNSLVSSSSSSFLSMSPLLSKPQEAKTHSP